MKFRALYKWRLTDSLDGLVFLAQRLDELLFDFTLDSYKPTALNACSLCEEALEVISMIERGHTDAATLEPVLQELDWSLRRDSVAKSLLDVDVEKYVLKHPETPLNDKKLRLEVLSRTIDSDRYLNECYDQLRAAVVARSKGDIDFLARTLVTSLINRGVSKTFLYQKTLEFFFRGDTPVIAAPDALDAFLESIRPLIHDCDVYFIVSPEIRKIESSIEAFNIKILSAVPQELADFAQGKQFAPKGEQAVVHVDEIRAYDCYSARERAERRIDMLRDLFTLFSHRNELRWGDAALIKQCCAESPAIVGLPRSSMQKRVDANESFASKRLNSMIRDLSLRFGNTFDKFNRIVDLHGICVTNNVPENQLLNLWISLETLVPTKGAKLSSVIHELEPFVRRNYIRRLIDAALRDLMLWDPGRTRSALRQVPEGRGHRMPVRLLLLLAVESNSALREQLYAALKDFHLLRFRIYSLHIALRSPCVVRDLLDEHWRKVEWQLRRIYRTRNSLVHDGERPAYLAALIENGHDYLDLVLDEVLDHSCGPRAIETLNQAFALEELLLERFRKTLSEIKSFDASNVAVLYQAPLYRPQSASVADGS